MATFWTENYQKHFQRFFHKPFDIQVYHDRDGFALKLATHDLARQGFRVLASMGLADKLVQNDEDEFGEVILFCDVPDKEIPQLFMNALFFILQHNIPLGSRFAIGFGDVNHPFARRHGKASLYFTRPADEDETFDEVLKGETVGRVFQAFFITPEEDDFLEEHGADAFEAEFRKQFGGKLTEEERVDLLVDKTKSQQLQARLQELAQQANRALSVRRPSCV
jgi:Suppressor of fused protein (SUFU)